MFRVMVDTPEEMQQTVVDWLRQQVISEKTYIKTLEETGKARRQIDAAENRSAAYHAAAEFVHHLTIMPKSGR